MSPRHLIVLATVVMLIALGAGAAMGADPKVGDEIQVGKNATGEDCRLRLLSSSESRIPSQRFSLLCEGWKVASGELRRGRADKEAVAAAALDEDAWPASWTDRLAGCAEAEPTSLLGSDKGALRRCHRQEGGWPLIIAAVKVGGRMYRFEGLPTNVRALVRGAQILEGQTQGSVTVSPGMLSSAIRRAETLVGPSGKLISVADVGAVETLWTLGKRYHYAGDFIAAEATYRRLIDLHGQLMGPNHPSSGIFISEMANEVSKQRRMSEADVILERAEPLVQGSDRATHYTAYLRHRGMNEIYKRRYADAARYAGEALKRSDGRNRSAIRDGHAHYIVALANFHLGKLDDASIAADRAAQAFDKPSSNWESKLWWQGETYELLGRIQRERKDYADALAQHERARERRWLMFGETPRVARSWVEIGLVHRAQGDQAKAVAAFRQAAAITTKQRWIVENMRPSVIIAQIQGLVDASASGPAEQRAALVADAFGAAQTPRSTVTQRALQAMATRVAAGDPTIAAAIRALQDSEQKRDALRVSLAQDFLAPPDERRPGAHDRLRAEHRDADRQAELHEERLQATFPRYARLLGHAPATADVVRGLLRPHEALVLLLSTSEGTFVFVVRANDIHVHSAAASTRELQQQVAALRKSLDLSAGDARTVDTAIAYRLYQTLLEPLRDKLAGATHLIAVPTGPLLDLPLSVLVTRPTAAPRGNDYRSIAWLGRDFAISVLPAVAALRDLRAVATRSAAPQPFLGVGDPAFAGTGAPTRAADAALQACRDEQGWDRAALRDLVRLPETADELRAMARTLGGKTQDVILGADATEARLRRTDLSQYRVVAFATHGLLPGELRCQAEAALTLTPGATTDRGDDGLLETSEIATLTLDADWVVLSACNTAGRDGRFGGDSLSGLTRAFFYAGARSVLASHWAVASEPTVALTTGAVDRHAREPGLGRAEALRRSMMAMASKAETSHPFFWAPFVLIGDGGH